MSAAWRERIRAAGGSVPCEEFMRFALYDPAHGYYAQRVRTVGREGDFSTSATLGSALGEAVAAWALRGREAGRRWHLIELGGGSGALAAGVLGALGWWARRGLRYHLVEISPGLRATQQAGLARWRKTVAWHATLAEALQAAGGVALIFSNEFVDAFPCARWVFDPEAGWREIWVAWDEEAGRVEERARAAVCAERRAATSVASMGAAPGQQAEVFESYRRWQREQLAGWQRGRMLTIDYGDRLPGLYRRRPAGTFRAYCRQMRFTGPECYERIGRQDLTADVNFTDLERWGAELGLVTGGYGTQAEFLRRWLPSGRLARTDARLAALLDPDGAGGAFKALEQVRGIYPQIPQI